MHGMEIGFRTGKGKRGASARIDEAIDFLWRELVDGSGYATDIKAAATAAGISERTLRRARKGLGIRPWKLPNGKWLWPPPQSRREGGQESAQPKNLDTSATLGKTNHLITYSPVSAGEGVQESESGHNAGQVRKKGEEPKATSAGFTLDQALDFIQDGTVKRQAREKIKPALEEAIPHAIAFRKIHPEKAITWLMGMCLQYYDAVRKSWPPDQWKHAKKPAEFLADKTWRENPVIWDRSQRPLKEKANGNSSSMEELRRATAAERAGANASNEPKGVLEPVSAIDGANTERGSNGSLFPNRRQLAPNGHRSGVRQSGALAQIFSKPRGPDRADR